MMACLRQTPERTITTSILGREPIDGIESGISWRLMDGNHIPLCGAISHSESTYLKDRFQHPAKLNCVLLAGCKTSFA